MEQHTRRRLQMIEARKLGRHTAEEWQRLLKDKDHCCEYCGKKVTERIVKEHRVPVSRGGSDHISNIAVSCVPCNSSKGNRTDEEFMRLRARWMANPLPIAEAQEKVLLAQATADEARATRDAIVRRERDEGRTIYAIARELGVSQNAVRRMLGLRKGK